MIRKENKNRGLKAAAIAGFMFGVGASFTAYITKKKNDEYRDALIEMSDMLPDEYETEAQVRRNSWQSSHSPEKRKTAEERLKGQRINEE